MVIGGKHEGACPATAWLLRADLAQGDMGADEMDGLARTRTATGADTGAVGRVVPVRVRIAFRLRIRIAFRFKSPGLGAP